MMISRIKIDNRLSWIEKENDKYFLLTGDPYSTGLIREHELQIRNESDLRFENIYEPANVFGLAYNYKSLVGKDNECDDPLVFFKTSNSVIANRGAFKIPNDKPKIWVECEMVVIIKNNCKNITVEDVPDNILGYTIGSDITAENNYGRDHHLALSKGRDGFAPLHRWINTDLDSTDLNMSTKINDHQFQQDSTGNRIWNEFQAIAYMSKYFTLKAGDIIFTGTPAGAMDSIIESGDIVEHTIENIGTMTFKVE